LKSFDIFPYDCLFFASDLIPFAFALFGDVSFDLGLVGNCSNTLFLEANKKNQDNSISEEIPNVPYGLLNSLGNTNYATL